MDPYPTCGLYPWNYLRVYLDPCYTLSMAFHPQIDGLSEWKNQWVEQYLRLVTSNNPRGWTHWLVLAMVIHNNCVNTTTGLSPNQILFRYNPTLNSNKVLQTYNALVESQVKTMTENCTNAIQALNRVVQSCHLLVCLFIYRHFTVKLAISEYDRWHLFVIYYSYLILTYC